MDERRVSESARRQHGLVTRGQARHEGWSDEAVDVRIESGRLETLQRGVYRVGGAPSSFEQRCMAACLAAGGGAVVSHRAAAQLWDLDGVERGVVEIAVPRTTQDSRRPGVVSHRSTDLRPDHVTTHHGIPITNPLRTIVDLGAVSPWWTVERALDDALGRKLVTLPAVVKVLRDVARPGRRGSGVLRQVLERQGPDPHGTRIEKLLWRIHLDHGLPRPQMQFTVRDAAGRFVARVDAAHPAARVLVEVDGFEKRASIEAFQHDRTRQNRLVELGWTVLRFTKADLVQRPEHVAGTIMRALKASALGGVGRG
ncbi:MAG TPA: type IV toxin-antitoxin system AbiEi family antitoxin domain-containing protein [Acidimicrobiia bacterium]|nr:type IV toxin-antitoxin system AbiEi family antitoxin domain-containing protein [Acidimicrobiia bacterium]